MQQNGVALSTIQVAVRYSLGFIPNFEEEYPGDSQGPPTSFPLPSTKREDLWLDGYLENRHAPKALYIYKHPCLLRDSNGRGNLKGQGDGLMTSVS
ncbi:hypothetical protein TNCV_1041911 [Trichonephila clavipes]|nr:hypothetical protein TNCV_1041911 [Trichonephila clavipes]